MICLWHFMRSRAVPNRILLLAKTLFPSCVRNVFCLSYYLMQGQTVHKLQMYIGWNRQKCYIFSNFLPIWNGTWVKGVKILSKLFFSTICALFLTVPLALHILYSLSWYDWMMRICGVNCCNLDTELHIISIITLARFFFLSHWPFLFLSLSVNVCLIFGSSFRYMWYLYLKCRHAIFGSFS